VRNAETALHFRSSLPYLLAKNLLFISNNKNKHGVDLALWHLIQL